MKDNKTKLPDVEDVISKERLAELEGEALVSGMTAVMLGSTVEEAGNVAVQVLRTEVINEYVKRLDPPPSLTHPMRRGPPILEQSRSYAEPPGWYRYGPRDLRNRTRHHMKMV